LISSSSSVFAVGFGAYFFHAFFDFPHPQSKIIFSPTISVLYRFDPSLASQLRVWSLPSIYICFPFSTYLPAISASFAQKTIL